MVHRYLELRINMFIEIQYKFCTSVKLTSDEVMHFKCCSSKKNSELLSNLFINKYIN